MHLPLTLQSFNCLTPSDRYDLLEREGTFLGVHYLQRSCKVALFDLKGLYVEVWLNQSTDELEKAEAFDDYARLDPFLAAVDVTGLYALL